MRIDEDSKLADQDLARGGTSINAEKGVTALGTAGGLTAVLSAAACCVLPLALAAVGLGAGGLAFLVPYHWPLTVGAGLAVATGWVLYARKRRACAKSSDCTMSSSTRATIPMLCLATAFVMLSALWPGYIEAPLMRLLGGA